MTPHVPPLKVTGRTDMERLAAYDFLLVIHSSHGRMLYRFQNKQILVENHKFFPPRVYNAPIDGVRLGIL